MLAVCLNTPVSCLPWLCPPFLLKGRLWLSGPLFGLPCSHAGAAPLLGLLLLRPSFSGLGLP